VTSELCNQVCGRSKILLRADGYNFDISVPEVFSSNDPRTLTHQIGYPKVALVFEYRKEHFYVLFWG
jgi:CheY-specific phosphatase CheX